METSSGGTQNIWVRSGGLREKGQVEGVLYIFQVNGGPNHMEEMHHMGTAHQIVM